jgi:hypothetical protein
MNPKEKIVKNISSKLYIYFNNKYKEQLIKIGLNESGIESIVIAKSNTTDLTRSTIPDFITHLQENINKIILKKIYELNNSNLIVKPSYNIENKATTDLNTELENKNNTTSIEKTNLNTELELDLDKIKSEYQEKFIIRDRKNEDTAIKNIIDLEDKQKQFSVNLVVNSDNRDVTKYNSPYNYKLNIDEISKLQHILITKISLISCIMKSTDLIKQNPFIILSIRELDTNFETSDNSTYPIFCYLELYKEQNGYLYYNLDKLGNIQEFDTLINLDSISIAFHSSNGKLITDNIEIQHLDNKLNNEVDLELDLDLDLEQEKEEQEKEKKDQVQSNKNSYEKNNKLVTNKLNNQLIFNIIYEIKK